MRINFSLYKRLAQLSMNEVPVKAFVGMRFFKKI